MRPAAAALSLGLLLTAPAALAAPTCFDREGVPIRCGAPGALPVGAKRPAAGALRTSPPPSGRKILGLICLLGGLFGLIAAMPRFDGDWDG